MGPLHRCARAVRGRIRRRGHGLDPCRRLGPGNRGFHLIQPALKAGWTDDIVDTSAVLARAVRDGLVSRGLTPANYIGSGGITSRGDLGTLNWADRPVTMIESGNMRDSQDVALLSSEAGRQQIAEGIAAGLAAFFG